MTACIEWQGSRTAAGYGQVGARGKNLYAHRVMYELVYGSIPEGAHILHSCDNPPCVNPLHLRAGTPAENMRDKADRGRHHNQRKTTCPEGHPYDERNTHIHPSGSRVCRTCRAAAGRRYRAKQGETS